jgi:hypothetical protein
MSQLKPLALAGALIGLGAAMLSVSVSAADIQEKVTVASGKVVNPREEAVISSAGVKVLRHIAQARSAIHGKDAQSARTDLGQVEKLLDIIQAALPTTTVKDRIWVAKKHLEYENTEEVLPDLIPIYSSLDELIDIMPVDMPKKHLEQAKEHLKSGDKKSAREALEATDAALQYTEVDLPLSTTRQLVAQAKADLDKEKLEDANKVLKSAEHSVVYLSIATEQPLFIAKALLWQTLRDLEGGDKNLAKADLQSAVGFLESASQSGQKSVQKAARQLLEQARQLRQDLEVGENIGTRLYHLWERTHALSERSVEYLSAGWARYRKNSPLKIDLIEAKLYFANARIDIFSGHKADKAKAELDTARQFFDQAAEHAKKTQIEDRYQKQITELQKTLKEISANPTSVEESRYYVLQNELRSMILSL